MAGTRGLGLACAGELLRTGHAVTVCGRDPERLDAAVTELGGLGPVTGERADVAAAEDVDRLVNGAVDRFGGLDVLVVNAGGPPAGDFGDVDMDDWDTAYALTLRSAVTAIRAAVPAMRRGGFGRVLVIGSSSVRRPLGGLVLSNVFRPALAGLVKSLATDLAPDGITVNMVSPGRIDTERVRLLDERRADREGGTAEAVRSASEAAIPAGRYGRPEELAAMVGFLAGEQAGYVTGQSLLVDGGLVPTLP
ncbi:3-oxoacyl-[acyl-carrier protein] reductase [Spinactinospora alkalitolerans]|uniref:3-oxoacyl-[acyl-carrier protein] reductase n=1 Tax=Spinactinospora alkalitolerans TaxID=687207 RepID=A0A852U3T0_9ACTN|nr:SDR family oxidoreductase [Spinactinospora alkalitolerans]NYE50849.1 3-oxoacyl-[acyl-carrier protein] reductase [Spinactinospora alkalitolerans]